MYAAVPCYNLPKLHRLLKKEMPWCPNGLYETWTHINGILQKQKQDPNYKYVAELPPKPAPVAKTPAPQAAPEPSAEPALS
jgi:fatty acid desaturase